MLFLVIYNCLESNLNNAINFGLFASILRLFSIVFLIIQLLYFNTGINYINFIIALIIPILMSCLVSGLIWFKYHPNYKEEARIRNLILDIGQKYSDFTLREIAKKCSVDKNTIIRVAKNMIANKEIYAKYFNGTKKFAFNKRANIEKINELMALYEEWESEHAARKI